MDNLKEMDKFLENFKFQRLNQEKIEILKRLITSTEMGTIIKNLPKNTIAQGQMVSQVNSIKHLETS